MDARTAAPAATRRTMPLRIHVATLLSVLLLIVGGALGWLGYRHSSAILWSASDRLMERVASNLETSVRATYRPATSAIDLLAYSPIGRARSMPSRLETLPMLEEVLANSPELSLVYAGYDDGDYFGLRRLATDRDRERLASPAEALYLVEHIDIDESGTRRRVHLFLDGALTELERRTVEDASYDPRARPWYKAAARKPERVLTAPYRFHLSGEPGITISRRFAGGGGAVAADVTLEMLSRTLASQAVTDSSELLLLDEGGRVLAHSDPAALRDVDTASDGMLPGPEAIGSELVRAAAGRLQTGEYALTFEREGRRWAIRLHELPTRGAGRWRLAMIVPEDELLHDATRLLQRSGLTAVGLVLALLPVAWLIASLIARPLTQLAEETRVIRRFDFGAPIATRSRVREIQDLADAMNDMKSTIDRFLALIGSLSREPAYERLLDRVLDETMAAAGAQAGIIYLLDDTDTVLAPASARALEAGGAVRLEVNAVPLTGESGDPELTAAMRADAPTTLRRERRESHPGAAFERLHEVLGADVLRVLALPLPDRKGRITGLLCLVNRGQAEGADTAGERERIGFVDALSGFAAVSLESQRLLKMEKDLLDAFIRLIAGAIDAKSPYTGGHCQRVPALTKMLARAAANSDEPAFRDFSPGPQEWEALHIASWLHDCGKVTTPEYVVDKATKLETIYDRIHEVRMRFEVVKRDAEIRHWKRIADGGDAADSERALEAEWRALDEDFAFVAECNEGGEFMAPERLERIDAIGRRTWTRTLDDRIGVSWEERARKDRTPAPTLPVEETLLADKDEHLIRRPASNLAEDLAGRGFKLDVPEHAYNRGELYNLAVARGTLTAEERFTINDHIVQTITMLEKLPFPRHLRDVPAIAGGHHEKMDGTGYPRRLERDEMPLSARIMAIADIFEALTASDRPYKKAKTLSEAVRIMGFMKKDRHVDPELFDLFVSSGVMLEYANEFLLDWQVDVQ